jgi:hypothetical protein
MIPERERAGVLIRLFAALFLLLPALRWWLPRIGTRMQRPLPCWCSSPCMPHCTCWSVARGCTAPGSPLLRALDTHAATVMLAATLMIIAIIAATATLPIAVCAVLLVGALCHLRPAHAGGNASATCCWRSVA